MGDNGEGNLNGQVWVNARTFAERQAALRAIHEQQSRRLQEGIARESAAAFMAAMGRELNHRDQQRGDRRVD